jgi:hypothetical protein
MPRVPLPVLDPDRVEFGFPRTRCPCAACAAPCSFIPGYLVPDDLPRLAAHHGPGADPLAWAAEHLLASPGALVARAGRAFRIPTLVPARGPGGACAFLADGGACAVHEAAPFGCAFFDSHMTAAQADRRSLAGLRAVARAWSDGGLYAEAWRGLAEAGRVAPAPEEARRQMREALGQR